MTTRYRLHESGDYWQRLDDEGKPATSSNGTPHRYTRPFTDEARQASCSHALMAAGTRCAWCGLPEVPA